MAVRSFKYITIAATNTPQPMFGTAVSAAVIPTPDNDAFTTGSVITSVPVADSSFFEAGDYITFATVSAGALINTETVKIYKVPDATHVQVQGMKIARALNDWAILAVPTNGVYVQLKDGGAAAVGVGTGPSLALATGVQMLAKLQNVAAGVQPIEWSSNRTSAAPNPVNSADYWVVGTNPDVYLPSLGQV